MQTNNPKIKSLINNISELAQSNFGNRCISVYVMGSLARGGFSEIASDIDLGLILEGQITENDAATISTIQDIATHNYPDVINAVSIFWGNIDSINGCNNLGRYPPFDRLDLIDHALLIFGRDIRNQLIKPTQKELEIACADFALDYLGDKKTIHEFLNCDLISFKDTVYISKLVLFPARFIYLANTGEIAGNENSKQYYISHFSGDDSELVTQAYQWRFNSLPKNRDTITDILNKGLIKLYSNFIDLYSGKMKIYHQYELNNRLIQWKQKITLK